MSRITCGSIATVACRRRPAEFSHDVLVSFLPWIVVDALHQLRPVFRLRLMNVVLQLFSSCLVVFLRRRYCNAIFATCASSGLLLPPTHAFRARGHDLTVPLVNHLSPADEGVLQRDSRVANRGSRARPTIRPRRRQVRSDLPEAQSPPPTPRPPRKRRAGQHLSRPFFSPTSATQLTRSPC